MPVSFIEIPWFEEKLRVLHPLFRLRRRVTIRSGEERFSPINRVNLWVEALWIASGRPVSADLKSELRAWERYVEDDKLPGDLFAGFCDMYMGLTHEMLTEKSREKFERLIKPQYDGYEWCKAALEHYEVSRPELQSLMRRYYRAQNSNRELPLITAPGWIPEHPILMTGSAGEPVFSLEQPDDPQPALPEFPRIPGLGATLHEVRQSLNKQGEMTNGETYRPLEIKVTDKGLHLVCTPGHYFDYHDTCEMLGVELSAWMLENRGLKPNPDDDVLPLRTHVKDIFNLRNRCAVLGVSTLLVALDTKGTGKYFWHKRSNKVAVNPEGQSVVPSGTFQPFSAKATFPANFTITRTILRELPKN